MEREERPRISVGSLHDWERVKSNYRQSATGQLEAALDVHGLQSERGAILAHFHQFVEATFSMAQTNLRVNGHSFAAIDTENQDMEAFDEALDRKIWGLADTRLQWHKRISKTRRGIPIDTEARLSELFNESHQQDKNIAEPKVMIHEGGKDSDDLGSSPVAMDAIEEFYIVSAMAEELDQNVPSQQERVGHVEKATSQVKYLKY